MTAQWLFLRSARQLITLRGSDGPRRGAALRELGIVGDGALLIRDGVIVDVGPTRRIENLAAARQAVDIDASGRVVMPAFIDSEVQLLWAGGLTRQAAGEAPDPGESVDIDWDEVARKLSASSSRHFESHARALLERMARHGTGQVEGLSGVGLDASGCFKALRIHASADRQPLTVISAFVVKPAKISVAEHKKPGIEQLCEDILPAIARRKLARFVALRVGAGESQSTYLKRIMAVSRGSGLGIKILCDQLDPQAGVQLGAEAGATSISRLSRARPAQVRQLAAAPAIALLTCAQTEISSAGQQMVARALVDEGAAVALGTGFRPNANGTYSMQHALYLGVNAMRLQPAEALAAATINAAHNQGAGSEAGSLEPGKRAGFIVLNVSHYRDLFLQPGVNALHLMVKAGRIVYREADVTW